MERFDNCTINKQIEDACKVASDLLHTGSSMINEISNKTDFKYNSGNGIQIALNLIKQRNPVKVYTYKPFNPFTSAIGYFDGNSIHINLRKLPLLSETLIGLLLHEYAHYCGYTHGNNFKSKDKCLFSVPYFLSENVSKWI